MYKIRLQTIEQDYGHMYYTAVHQQERLYKSLEHLLTPARWLITGVLKRNTSVCAAGNEMPNYFQFISESILCADYYLYRPEIHTFNCAY